MDTVKCMQQPGHGLVYLVQRPKWSLFITFAMVIFIITATNPMIFPKMLTRFCYNSPDPARVNSQCIYCNYFSFDNTVLGCTGSSAVTINMTATQAFCVISQCLGQIRQIPIFLGKRKRRSIVTSNASSVVSESKMNHLIHHPSGNSDFDLESVEGGEKMQMDRMDGEKKSKSSESFFQQFTAASVAGDKNNYFTPEAERKFSPDGVNGQVTTNVQFKGQDEEGDESKKGEKITFNLNGKDEEFIVARQVEVNLDELPLDESDAYNI